MTNSTPPDLDKSHVAVRFPYDIRKLTKAIAFLATKIAERDLPPQTFAICTIIENALAAADAMPELQTEHDVRGMRPRDALRGDCAMTEHDGSGDVVLTTPVIYTSENTVLCKDCEATTWGRACGKCGRSPVSSNVFVKPKRTASAKRVRACAHPVELHVHFPNLAWCRACGALRAGDAPWSIPEQAHR